MLVGASVVQKVRVSNTEPGNERKMRLLLKVPSDGNHALSGLGDLVEGTSGEIKRVLVCAGWASISNSGNDGLAVVVIGDVDLLAAETRLLVESTVAAVVGSNNEVAVGMLVTASAGVAILGEPGRANNKGQHQTRGQMGKCLQSSRKGFSAAVSALWCSRAGRGSGRVRGLGRGRGGSGLWCRARLWGRSSLGLGSLGRGGAGSLGSIGSWCLGLGSRRSSRSGLIVFAVIVIVWDGILIHGGSSRLSLSSTSRSAGGRSALGRTVRELLPAEERVAAVPEKLGIVLLVAVWAMSVMRKENFSEAELTQSEIANVVTGNNVRNIEQYI